MFREFLYLLPCMVCLFWAVVLVVEWKRNLRTQKTGAVLLLICAVNLFYWGFSNRWNADLYAYSTLVISFTQVGVYSLFWLAYQSLIDQRALTWKDYAVFIPPLLIGTVYTLALLRMGVGNYLTFIEGYEDPKSQQPFIIDLSTSLVHVMSAFVNNLVTIIAIALTLASMAVRLIWYKDNRKDFFSRSEEKQSLKHSCALFYGAFVMLAFMLVILVGEFLYYIEDYIPFYILFTLAGCLLHYLGYHLYFLNKGEQKLPLSARIGTTALCLIGIGVFIRLFSLSEPYKGGFYLLETLEVFCTLGFFSCLILYFRTLTDDRPLSRKSGWVFLPGLLVSGALLCLYFLAGRETMDLFIRDTVHTYYTDRTYPDPFCRTYYMIYRYIYRIVVITLAGGVLLYGGIYLRGNKEHSRGMPGFLLAVVLYAILLLVWYQLFHTRSYRFIHLCMFLWVCALYYLGYHILQPGHATTNQAAEPEEDDEEIFYPEESDDEPEEAELTRAEEEIWNKIKEKLQPVLHQLIDEEKVFTERNLRLDDLASKANTNRTYLSRLIREEYGYGFPEFIARRRIDYACRLIHENPNLTLEQLAERSGFSYGTAFSRIFKQYTGVTFREWRRNT